MFQRTALIRAYASKALVFVGDAVSDVYVWAAKSSFISFITYLLNKLPMTTAKRLMRRIVALCATLLIITSVVPYGMTGAYSYDASSEDTYLIADQEGYLIKSNPITIESDRETMTDRVVHVVAPGETVSEIAEKYGLKGETLLWENNIYNPNSIKVGQKLVVPPVNGVTHKVLAGETLDKIATKYKIEKELIVQQNQLDDELVLKGQELFIPGGKAIESPYYGARAYASRSGTASRYVADYNLPGSDAVPSPGSILIFPTRGKISQGWRWGHYAVDIADVSKPPIWAAASGTVESVASGWSGGYGNHVVIDHGNGLKTLYAHLEYYTVQPGQEISQGQVIGKMGNTGRVYGMTGIHLHFEVINNGVKQYPGNFW